jgi:hypothetical protein
MIQIVRLAALNDKNPQVLKECATRHNPVLMNEIGVEPTGKSLWIDF